MNRLVLILIVSVFFTSGIGTTLNCVAQEKNDVVVMKNGENRTGKVLGITDNTIKFKYSGEDLEYEFQKSDIFKIDFASGRVEVINDMSQSSTGAVKKTIVADAGDRKNKLAVLPFEYITGDPSIPVESMSKQIQSECVNIFRDETRLLQMQDPMVTNSILAKNDISAENYRTILPKDMALILGVEYVVYGTFNVQNEGQMTTGSAVTTYKDKESQKREDDRRSTKSSGTAVSSNSSYTKTNYDTRIELNIYNDAGNNLYSDSRKPFSGDPQGYSSGLKYLIKRCPFGSKAK